MVDVELLSILFNAIHWPHIKRLIFVGDHHQLPPIGPGKPFADFFKLLEEQSTFASHLHVLTQNCRQIEEDSTALALASAFTSTPHPDVDEIFCKTAKGGKIGEDLEVRFWNDEYDLPGIVSQAICDVLKKEVGYYDSQRPWEAFNQLLNLFSDNEPCLSRIQILSPYRGEYFGTEAMNILCQKKFRQKLLQSQGSVAGFTQCDKVIQVVNKSLSFKSRIAWDEKSKEHVGTYLANGDLGYVRHLMNASKLRICYEGKGSVHFFLNRSLANEFLELGYAISTHKAQGSEFDIVILILPYDNLSLMSQELVYTALTRAKKKTILLLQKNIDPLFYALRLENSALLQRNSSLFTFDRAPIPEQQYRPEDLVYGTVQSKKFRSKSELIIAQLLNEYGVEFYYEKPLKVSETNFRRPDFTFAPEFGEEIYWEHAGMLDDEGYRESFERKKAWYKRHFQKRKLIITTEDNIKDLDSIRNIIKNELS